MPITRRFDGSLGIVRVSWEGPITKGDLARGWAERMEDAKGSGHRRILVDIRQGEIKFQGLDMAHIIHSTARVMPRRFRN